MLEFKLFMLGRFGHHLAIIGELSLFLIVTLFLSLFTELFLLLTLLNPLLRIYIFYFVGGAARVLG